MPTEYGLIEPFPTDCVQFALGVEWELFRQRLRSGEPFSALVTTRGADGIIAMCERQRRFCESNPVEGLEEYWTQIRVGNYK